MDRRIPKTAVIAIVLWALLVLVAEAGGGLRSVDKRRQLEDQEDQNPEETDDGGVHHFQVSVNPPLHFTDDFDQPSASPGTGGNNGKAPPVASGTLQGEQKTQSTAEEPDEDDLKKKAKNKRKRQKERMKESEALLEDGEGPKGDKKKKKKKKKRKQENGDNDTTDQALASDPLEPSDPSVPGLTPPTDINAANAATLSSGNSFVGFDLEAHSGSNTPAPAPAIPGDPANFPTHDEFLNNKSPRPPTNPVGAPSLPLRHSGGATDSLAPSPVPTSSDHIPGDPANFPSSAEFINNKSPGIPTSAMAPPPSPAQEELEDENER